MSSTSESISAPLGGMVISTTGGSAGVGAGGLPSSQIVDGLMGAALELQLNAGDGRGRDCDLEHCSEDVRGDQTGTVRGHDSSIRREGGQRAVERNVWRTGEQLHARLRTGESDDQGDFHENFRSRRNRSQNSCARPGRRIDAEEGLLEQGAERAVMGPNGRAGFDVLVLETSRLNRPRQCWR
jgi:hypothetical protein